MSNWPTISSNQSIGNQKPPMHYCESFTKMPCGERISVKTEGYNPKNTKRRAEAAVTANAKRHLRSCRKCPGN